MDELAKFELEVLLASSPSSTHAELRLLHHILHELKEIRLELKPRQYPVSATITQGETMSPLKRKLTASITGLVPGASDSFFATPVDVNGNADALPAGSPTPTWAADDASVTIAPAADGLSAVVTAPASATAGGSFNLIFSAPYTNPNTGAPVNISKTVNVPYLAPPTLEPVDAVISQGAPAA